jgi:hypothetical protein
LFLSPYINVLLTKAFQHLADDAFHVLLVDLAFRADGGGSKAIVGAGRGRGAAPGR